MRIVIICSNLEPALARLQPYRTILEIGRSLKQRGHEVTFISDGAPEHPHVQQVLGLQINNIESVRYYRGLTNKVLVEKVSAAEPDVVLREMGIFSFVHQQVVNTFAAPTVALLASPAHPFGDILNTLPWILESNLDIAINHTLSSLVPSTFIRNVSGDDTLSAIITFSEATRQFLLDRGARANKIQVVPPGIDSEWLETTYVDSELKALRNQLGFEDQDFVVTYFGSPAPIRGIFTLIEAVRQVANDYPRVKLLALSRRKHNRWVKQSNQLHDIAMNNGNTKLIRIVDGFLERQELIKHIAASDVVCLPFELLPSDVPLSILESMAAGTPVITTLTACIPELVNNNRGYLIEPGSVESLADCIRSIIANPEATEACRQDAREYVESSRRWTDMGDAVERVLQGVCNA